MDALFSRKDTSTSTPAPVKRAHLPWFQSPILEDEREEHLATNGATEISPAVHRSSRNRIDAVPKFRHYSDSNTIELLYDLFFVANLSNFTALHGVEDRKSLQNYIGFFTIIWFTFLQTTLKDVRFGSDSVFDRVCKAITL